MFGIFNFCFRGDLRFLSWMNQKNVRCFCRYLQFLFEICIVIFFFGVLQKVYRICVEEGFEFVVSVQGNVRLLSFIFCV